MVPQSFTPRSRLIADITRPPRKPIMQIARDTNADCHGVKGVIQDSAVPVRDEERAAEVARRLIAPIVG